MGCEGCYTEQKSIEQSISSVYIKAKQFAIDNETEVFIYKDEIGQPQFMAAGPARQIGIIPTIAIVSPMR